MRPIRGFREEGQTLILIRGFREEGQTLRGEEPVSRSLGQRLLCNSDYQKQLNRNHVASNSNGVASHESCVTDKDKSGDSHASA